MLGITNLTAKPNAVTITFTREDGGDVRTIQRTIPGIQIANLTTQIAEELGAPNTRGALINQIAPRSNHVPEHAENVNLELFDLAALPNGEPGGFHAGLDLIDGEVGAGRRQRHRQQRHAREEGENKSLHIVVITGKPSVAIVAQTLTKSKTS